MRFKFDENIPAELAALLRRDDHDAHSEFDEQLCGVADQTIAKVWQDEQRILITLDIDFANIRSYPPRDYHGIIVLRLVRQDRDAVLAIMPRILALLLTEQIARRLWIVDETRTRIRGEAS